MLTLMLGGTALVMATGKLAYALIIPAGWIAGDLIEKHTHRSAVDR